MAEAMISRGYAPSLEDSLVVVPGYASLLVQLKTKDGIALSNTTISVKDGSTYYNYTSNEKGMCQYTLNSGYANIYVSNSIGGKTYQDISPTWMNIDLPVGTKKVVNFVHNEPTFYQANSSQTINLIRTHMINLHIVGGGGGGGWGDWDREDGFTYYTIGAGGGAGYMNTWSNYELEKGSYSFIAGTGGRGGYRPNSNSLLNGATGGTSYISGTEFSAAGGGGAGSMYSHGGNAWAGIGGLGNGGGRNDANYYALAPTRGNVTFAGGGGGHAYVNNGYGNLFGGNATVPPTNGTRGGGGGGAPSSTSNRNLSGGWGGNGVLRINFLT